MNISSFARHFFSWPACIAIEGVKRRDDSFFSLKLEPYWRRRRCLMLLCYRISKLSFCLGINKRKTCRNRDLGNQADFSLVKDSISCNNELVRWKPSSLEQRWWREVLDDDCHFCWLWPEIIWKPSSLENRANHFHDFYMLSLDVHVDQVEGGLALGAAELDVFARTFAH